MILNHITSLGRVLRVALYIAVIADQPPVLRSSWITTETFSLSFPKTASGAMDPMNMIAKAGCDLMFLTMVFRQTDSGLAAGGSWKT